MLAQLALELRAGLALTGCARAQDAGPHLLAGAPAWPPR